MRPQVELPDCGWEYSSKVQQPMRPNKIASDHRTIPDFGIGPHHPRCHEFASRRLGVRVPERLTILTASKVSTAPCTVVLSACC